jgi:hypothetical protein
MAYWFKPMRLMYCREGNGIYHGVSPCYYFIFMWDVGMGEGVRGGCRGCDDGWTFNTRMAPGYLDARCSIQFIMQPVGMSSIHMVYTHPLEDSSGLASIILIAVIAVIMWKEIELTWYQEPYWLIVGKVSMRIRLDVGSNSHIVLPGFHY